MKKILSMMLVLSVAWVTQSMAEEQTDAAEVSEWVEHFLERKRQAIEMRFAKAKLHLEPNHPR